MNVLTKEEYTYLSNVIAPFRDKVVFITKVQDCEEEQNIYITLKSVGYKMIFPPFVSHTMYCRMKLFRNYTLKELGL